MAMQLNSILIRNSGGAGDLQATRAHCLQALGHASDGDTRVNVPGAFVHRTALAMQDEGAHEILRVAQGQGHTVLSDGRGDLVMDLETWCALSKQLRTTIVTARHDALGVEFAVFEHGQLRRLASWEAGEAPLSLGEALPQECLFAESCPTLPELFEWIACMGVDLQRLNQRALYELTPICPDEGGQSSASDAAQRMCVAV